MNTTISFKNEFRTLSLIIFICYFLFFYNLGDRPFWEYDEAKHAQVAKEMLTRGDWCTPTFNGEIFYDKPILHFWFVIISYTVFGINEFAARLPSAVLGTAGVLLLYVWGRYLFGNLTGAFSALVLATSVEYIILSKNIIHDMSLCFFMNAALFLFHRANRENNFSLGSFIAFSIFLGCAVLAKGPIGILLPGLIICIFLFILKKWHLLINRKLFLGIPVFLLIILPWYVLISSRHPDYLETFLLQGNIARFFSGESPHQEPFYFYLLVILIGFLPWSVFIPSVLLHHIREYTLKKSPDILLLLIAVFVPFVFFSLARSKLPTYIIIIFPSLSMLVGSFITYGLRNELDKRWGIHFKYCCTAFFILIFVSFIGGGFFVYRTYPQYLSKTFMWGLLFIACGCVFLFFGLKRKVIHFVVSLIVLMVISIIAITHFVFPEVSHFKSARNLSQTVKSLIPPAKPVVFYKDLRESVIFYSERIGKKIKSPEEFEQYMNFPDTVYCLINAKRFKKFKKVLSISMYQIDREGNLVLISNKKP